MSTPVDLERPALRWERAAGGPVDFTIWPARPVSIGRDASNTIAIESPFVSKAHAIFQYSAGQYSVEDLGSANGTRLNGVPVTVARVLVGDVIEIGDERLVFIDRVDAAPAAAPETTGLGKNAKLALAAGGTIAAVGGLLALFVLTAPAPKQDVGTDAAAKPVITPNPDAPEVAAIIARAGTAGIAVADALVDEAEVQLRIGRPRDATNLLAGAVARDPKNQVARNRLRDATAHLSRMIDDEVDRAEKSTSELRTENAAAAWERVLLLTDARDPRHARAEAALARSRK